MAYTKTTWVNDSQPAISAENLNNIENGISALDTAVGSTDISGVGDGTVTGAISTLNSSLTKLKTFRVVEYTVLSQGGTSATYYEKTINVSLSGYTMLSIAGYKTSQVGVYPYSIVPNHANNTAFIGISKVDSTSLSQAIFYIYVLYYKN